MVEVIILEAAVLVFWEPAAPVLCSLRQLSPCQCQQFLEVQRICLTAVDVVTVSAGFLAVRELPLERCLLRLLVSWKQLS
jgi:hypothetical protein